MEDAPADAQSHAPGPIDEDTWERYRTRCFERELSLLETQKSIAWVSEAGLPGSGGITYSEEGDGGLSLWLSWPKYGETEQGDRFAYR